MPIWCGGFTSIFTHFWRNRHRPRAFTHDALMPALTPSHSSVAILTPHHAHSPGFMPDSFSPILAPFPVGESLGFPHHCSNTHPITMGHFASDFTSPQRTSYSRPALLSFRHSECPQAYRYFHSYSRHALPFTSAVFLNASLCPF